MNVEITGLTRRFGRTMAVAGVDLQAGPGVFGLLGPNGAGKTSLLRVMATAIRPTSGALRLLGRDPSSYGPRREIRRRLGYLPQNLGYYPGFTVAEFVEYFALLKEVPAARIPAADGFTYGPPSPHSKPLTCRFTAKTRSHDDGVPSRFRAFPSPHSQQVRGLYWLRDHARRQQITRLRCRN